MAAPAIAHADREAEEALRLFEDEGGPPSGSTALGATLPSLRGPSRADRNARLALQMFEHEQETGESMSDDDVARAYVGQESLIEGEPLGFGQRALLSLLGDTPEEIAVAAGKYLDPELEILPVPDTGVVLFRKAEGENYRKVDKGFVEGLVNEGAMGELGRDTLEFLRVAPIVAIEVRFGKGSGTWQLARCLVRLGCRRPRPHLARSDKRLARCWGALGSRGSRRLLARQWGNS